MTAKSVAKSCSVQGCLRKHQSQGFCIMHYNRWKRNGDPLVSKAPTWGVDMSDVPCRVRGCRNALFVKVRRLCRMHYYRWREHGDASDVRHFYGYGKTPEERFWSRVDKTPGQGPHGDCWEWTGNKKDGTSYGCITFEGWKTGTHVLAWTLANGRRPLKGLLIMHSCDNPPCCNPAHLSEGTYQQNNQDAHTRGGHRKKTCL